MSFQDNSHKDRSIDYLMFLVTLLDLHLVQWSNLGVADLTPLFHHVSCLGVYRLNHHCLQETTNNYNYIGLKSLVGLAEVHQIRNNRQYYLLVVIIEIRQRDLKYHY